MKRYRGLSFIEVLTAITILVLFTAILYPTWDNMIKHNEETGIMVQAPIITDLLLTDNEELASSVYFDKYVNTSTFDENMFIKQATVIYKNFIYDDNSINFGKPTVLNISPTLANVSSIQTSTVVGSSTSTVQQASVSINYSTSTLCSVSGVVNRGDRIVSITPTHILTTSGTTLDGLITTSYRFNTSIVAGDVNYITVLIPPVSGIAKLKSTGNTFISFYYSTNETLLPSNLCSIYSQSQTININRNYSVIDLRTATGYDNGAYIKFQTTGKTSATLGITLIPKVQSSTIYWQVFIGIRFVSNADREDLLISQYYPVPDASTIQVPIVVVTSTPSDDWADWQNLTFNVDNNTDAYLSLTCLTCTTVYNFRYSQSGTYTIPLYMLGLPKSILTATFTVYPINPSLTASVYNINLYYYRKE